MVEVYNGTAITGCVTVTDSVIYIDTQYLLHKDFSMEGKEFLIDIFGKYYAGQRIHTVSIDGENLEHTGFIAFLEYLCDIFNIDHSRVTVENISGSTGKFKHILRPLSIFYQVKQYLPEELNQDLQNAKFVGTSLGRFSPARLQLAYQIDKIFPTDNYTIFQTPIREVERYLSKYSNLYSDELEWIRQHQFESDLRGNSLNGTVGWETACAHYGNIWNKYCIEIVSETDVLSNCWFTEKTARCLATGKPFVLVAGQGSLSSLHNMGFKTYSDLIDESYDLAAVPARRIDKMLESLRCLYQDPDRSNKLNIMYDIAKHNILQYNKLRKL